jgi:hypothetical protein
MGVVSGSTVTVCASAKPAAGSGVAVATTTTVSRITCGWPAPQPASASNVTTLKTTGFKWLPGRRTFMVHLPFKANNTNMLLLHLL